MKFITILTFLTFSSLSMASNNCSNAAENVMSSQGYRTEQPSLVEETNDTIIYRVRGDIHGGQAQYTVTLDHECKVLNASLDWSE